MDYKYDIEVYRHEITSAQAVALYRHDRKARTAADRELPVLARTTEGHAERCKGWLPTTSQWGYGTHFYTTPDHINNIPKDSNGNTITS